MMPVGRPIANIVQIHLHELALNGAMENAGLQIWSEDFGEEGENIYSHYSILVPRQENGKVASILTSLPDEW
jgi:hypothetical protein